MFEGSLNVYRGYSYQFWGHQYSLLLYSGNFEKIFSCIKADIRDLSAITSSLQDQDVVFHTAAKPGIWGDYNDFYQTDVQGTKNIILACHKNKVKKLQNL